MNYEYEASPTPTKPNCIKYRKTEPKSIGCVRGSKNGLKFSSYKTCGNTNPYYKCWDLYYSIAEGRYINRCQLENYYANFIKKGIPVSYNPNIYGYYMSIAQYLVGAYKSLMEVMQIRYSNLSAECSALIVIKRVLSVLFCQDQAAEIISMMKMDEMCVGQEDYL